MTAGKSEAKAAALRASLARSVKNLHLARMLLLLLHFVADASLADAAVSSW